MHLPCYQARTLVILKIDGYLFYCIRSLLQGGPAWSLLSKHRKVSCEEASLTALWSLKGFPTQHHPLALIVFVHHSQLRRGRVCVTRLLLSRQCPNHVMPHLLVHSCLSLWWLVRTA